MAAPATEYGELTIQVERLILDAQGSDPTVRAYMIARAALLWVARHRSAEKASELASELAYKMADEIATL